MKRIWAAGEAADSWITPFPPDEVRQRIERLLATHKVRIVQADDDEIAGKQGSQFLTRLLGGWFVNPAKFPKLIAIQYARHGSGSKVEVRIEETMGVGVLDGHFKNRYESYFAEFISTLRRELRPVEQGDADIVSAEVVHPPEGPSSLSDTTVADEPLSDLTRGVRTGIDWDNRTETCDFWVGVFPNEAAFFDYFGESTDYYDDPDDSRPLTKFASGQGETWYDHDMIEMGFNAEAASIAELTKPYSYSDQYESKLTELAAGLGVEGINAFVFIRAGEIAEPRTVIDEAFQLHYVGRITYKI